MTPNRGDGLRSSELCGPPMKFRFQFQKTLKLKFLIAKFDEASACTKLNHSRNHLCHI